MAALALAGALCLGWLLLALTLTRDDPLLTADSLEYASIARSLLEGHGYRLDFLPFHLGLQPELRHVPELHGLLRPFVLLPLFALFGAGDALVRVPGLLYVAGSAGVAFLFARRMFGPGAGLVACGITLAQPLLLFAGRTGNDDAGFAFFALCTLWLLHGALTEGRGRGAALAGLAAGAAVLEKLAGVSLLAVLLWPAWRSWRDPHAFPRARLALLFGPFGLALAAHSARNLAAHGSPLPRFGPVDWLFKAGGNERYERLLALHDPMPRLGETLAELGPTAVGSIVATQLGAVFRWLVSFDPGLHFVLARSSVLTPGLLAGAGLLAFAIHARREPAFAALCGLALAGSLALVCGLYHAELRYFVFTAPLLAISLAGLPVLIAEGGDGGPLRRGLALALAVALVAAPVAVFARDAVFGPRLASRQGIGACRPALDHFLRSTPAGTPLLTFTPWSVTWETRRPSAQVPSGGKDPLEKVARHYNIEWLLLPARTRRPETLRRLQSLPQPQPGAAFSAQTTFESKACRLLHLTWK